MKYDGGNNAYTKITIQSLNECGQACNILQFLLQQTSITNYKYWSIPTYCLFVLQLHHLDDGGIKSETKLPSLSLIQVLKKISKTRAELNKVSASIFSQSKAKLNGWPFNNFFSGALSVFA